MGVWLVKNFHMPDFVSCLVLQDFVSLHDELREKTILETHVSAPLALLHSTQDIDTLALWFLNLRPRLL
jgi:hypothetical protein